MYPVSYSLLAYLSLLHLDVGAFLPHIVPIGGQRVDFVVLEANTEEVVAIVGRDIHDPEPVELVRPVSLPVGKRVSACQAEAREDADVLNDVM